MLRRSKKPVLLVVNNKPITLEAFVYGICSAIMIISVLYWFKTFSLIMTSDKTIYITGRFSNKIAMIISMTLRYIPLFKLQFKKVSQTQQTLGIYNTDNIIDNIKGKIRVFSVMVTWTLENGIITAESMEARGYGIGKRSQYSSYKLNSGDIAFLIILVSLSVLSIVFISNSSFSFYPQIDYTATPTAYIGYASYFILTLLPVSIEVKEKIKWKYLEQKI
jgi:energy-coupling factor transport system permease protein